MYYLWSQSIDRGLIATQRGEEMAQIFNFSSGPAMLPAEVLKQAQQELRDWNGLGTSVMEVSHRGKEFIQVAEEAEKDFRDLLNVPSNYKVLFCHGGGRGQFAAVPLNILGDKTTADYVDAGYWAASAIKEAKNTARLMSLTPK